MTRFRRIGWGALRKYFLVSIGGHVSTYCSPVELWRELRPVLFRQRLWLWRMIRRGRRELEWSAVSSNWRWQSIFSSRGR